MCFDVGTLNDAPQILDRVFFEGTGALAQGTALCFNQDYGTATSVDDSRVRRVELPNSTNHNWFAGVVTQAYAANPAGQWVTIARPGSVVQVLTDGAITAIGQVGGFLANDAGSLATQANVGKWSATYSAGRGTGSVEFIQTAVAAGLVQARVLDGPAVGGVEVFTGPGTATVISPFGVSALTNSADNSSGSNPWTVANGTFIGQRKRLVFVSIATANKVDFGAATLASIAGAANRYASAATNANYINLEWTGTHWKIIMMSPSGITLS